MKPSKSIKLEIAAKIEAGIKQILSEYNSDAAEKFGKGTAKSSLKLAKKFKKIVKELEKKAKAKEKKEKEKLQKQALKARKLAKKLKKNKVAEPATLISKSKVSGNGVEVEPVKS